MPSSPSDYETILSDAETFLFDGRECAQHIAITTKNYGEDTGSIREGRQLANAHLMAAAPALYEALEAVVAERAYEREHGLKHALVTAADKMADAALSQAHPPKGEEPANHPMENDR